MARMRTYALRSPQYRCMCLKAEIIQLNRRLLLLYAPPRSYRDPPRNLTLRHFLYKAA
jgi:hypothetical protein